MESMPLGQHKGLWIGSVCLFIDWRWEFFYFLSKERGEVNHVRIGVTLTPIVSPFLIAEKLDLFEKNIRLASICTHVSREMRALS
ncbi:hypothetical protein QW180_27195 [Vibrio sinaloensis]|nr:hypothetical protein [Vibrio sinaloensis]